MDAEKQLEIAVQKYSDYLKHDKGYSGKSAQLALLSKVNEFTLNLEDKSDDILPACCCDKLGERRIDERDLTYFWGRGICCVCGHDTSNIGRSGLPMCRNKVTREVYCHNCVKFIVRRR